MPMELTRYKLTVDQYLQMAEGRILPPDVRCELIDGEILVMASMGPPHMAVVGRAAKLLIIALGDRACVFVQSTMRIGRHSAPEPDLAIMAPRDDFYGSRFAEPSEVLLIIEVADSSLSFDRGEKVELYRTAGIAEYWIVNVPDRVIEVHRGDAAPLVVRRGETLAPLAFPDLMLRADDLLG